VPGPGRNQLCPCGSGRKVKRCCGQRRGPSDDQLAVAHLAALAREAVEDLALLSDEALDRLWEDLFDLPAIDPRLWVELPRDDDPHMRRIQRSIGQGELEPDWHALTAIADEIASPRQRATLADAIVQLRDERRLHWDEAAYAIFDLHANSPSRFVTASVVAAVAAAMTVPAGLAA
jgi:SEC-C motif